MPTNDTRGQLHVLAFCAISIRLACNVYWKPLVQCKYHGRIFGKVLLPCINRKGKENNLNEAYPALVWFIIHFVVSVQRRYVLQKLEANNVHIIIVPTNCNNHLQPLDISVNKSAKEYLHRQFNTWYSDQIHMSSIMQENPPNADHCFKAQQC